MGRRHGGVRDSAARRLGRKAGLRDFDCGEPALNEYLHRYAQRSQASHFAVTYVGIAAGASLVTSTILRG